MAESIAAAEIAKLEKQIEEYSEQADKCVVARDYEVAANCLQVISRKHLKIAGLATITDEQRATAKMRAFEAVEKQKEYEAKQKEVEWKQAMAKLEREETKGNPDTKNVDWLKAAVDKAQLQHFLAQIEAEKAKPFPDMVKVQALQQKIEPAAGQDTAASHALDVCVTAFDRKTKDWIHTFTTIANPHSNITGLFLQAKMLFERTSDPPFLDRMVQLAAVLAKGDADLWHKICIYVQTVAAQFQDKAFQSLSSHVQTASCPSTTGGAFLQFDDFVGFESYFWREEDCKAWEMDEVSYALDFSASHLRMLPFFGTRELLRLWAWLSALLEDKNDELFRVTGQPGCGKTSTVMAMMQHQAKVYKKKIIMMFLKGEDGKKSICDFLFMDGTGVRKLETDATVDPVQRLGQMVKTQVNIVVVDGVSLAEYAAYERLLSSISNTKRIMCTSHQLDVRVGVAPREAPGATLFRRDAPPLPITFYCQSWSERDYFCCFSISPDLAASALTKLTDDEIQNMKRDEPNDEDAHIGDADDAGDSEEIETAATVVAMFTRAAAAAAVKNLEATAGGVEAEAIPTTTTTSSQQGGSSASSSSSALPPSENKDDEDKEKLDKLPEDVCERIWGLVAPLFPGFTDRVHAVRSALCTRFFQAGYCARFMFQFSLCAIQEVTWSILQSGSTSSSAVNDTTTMTTKNRIQGMFLSKDNRPMFVPASRFIRNSLVGKHLEEMYQSTKALLERHPNPSVDGFVFEWSVLDAVAMREKIILKQVCPCFVPKWDPKRIRLEMGGEESERENHTLVPALRVQKPRESSPLQLCQHVGRDNVNVELPGRLQKGVDTLQVDDRDAFREELKNPTWLIPLKWNEAMWDLAYFVPKTHSSSSTFHLECLTTVQLAAAMDKMKEYFPEVATGASKKRKVAEPLSSGRNTLMLFQMTKRTSHGLALQPAQQLVNKLPCEIDIIYVIAITPPNVRPQFCFDLPKGAQPANTRGERIPICYLVCEME